MDTSLINNQQKLEGVILESLNQLVDERGAVFHYLKKSNPFFESFGEAYFSKINGNIIKGWKYHERFSQYFSVPFGEIQIVIYDSRKDSSTYNQTNTYILNDSTKYSLLILPPQVWYSFKCLSPNFALLANIISEIHDPSETKSLPLNNLIIPYEWK